MVGTIAAATVVAGGAATVSAATFDPDSAKKVPTRQALSLQQGAGAHAPTTPDRGRETGQQRDAYSAQQQHASSRQFTAQQAREARREAARRAKAKAAARRKHKSSSVPGGSPSAPTGSPKAIAKALLPSEGWSSSQFKCLVPLWNKESHWNVHASNPSGAYGIPQAKPGSKMSSAGPDWQNNAKTQIKWGFGYIKSRYGSPCSAWSHSQSSGWY